MGSRVDNRARSAVMSSVDNGLSAVQETGIRGYQSPGWVVIKSRKWGYQGYQKSVLFAKVFIAT
jgi:hypothetical protein